MITALYFRLEMEKFLKDEKCKVLWLACFSKGSKVCGQHQASWSLKSGGILTNGYRAARLVKGEDGLYKVTCSINKTYLGFPIYSTSAVKVKVDESGKIVPVDDDVVEDLNDENESTATNRNVGNVVKRQISSLYITTVSNEILKILNVKYNKRWSGVKFFGLNREDVQNLLVSNEHGKNVAGDSSNNNCNVFIQKSEVEEVEFEDNCTWLGVYCYGERVTGEFSRLYEKTYKNTTFYLRHGFTSTRAVKCQDEHEKSVLVTCKVLASGPTPQFICETNNSSVQSDNITVAVSQMLSQIKAITKKHWSGFEFFGFYRADIMKILEKVVEKVDNSLLKDIANIRGRNGGPTSNLKSKKSKEKRNEKINEVVDYASFNDVKSKYKGNYLKGTNFYGN